MSENGMNFSVGSLYGAHTKQPLVHMKFKKDEGGEEFETQMTILQAKRIAYMILDAVEASLTDAAMIEFFKEELKAPIDQIQAMILAMREWRNKSDPRYFEE